ncbi:MAG: alanine racemase [Candidatus Zixiibacteriota bacterium]
MLHMLDLDTPCLLIDRVIMEANLARMQATADSHHVRLRPHIKTHKSPRLAHQQLQIGAVGIAVAKLAEAELMAAHGLNDIQIANQVVGREKIERLARLATSAHVTCAVDSIENVVELSAIFAAHQKILDLLIEIDTGLHRCGLSEPNEVIALASHIRSLPGLRLLGAMTHAGHAYAAGSPAELRQIGTAEGQTMVQMAEKLCQAGFPIEVVSVGSTPTAPYACAMTGVTELRVGNYIFNDMIQVALGSATVDSCALTLLATVISRPAADRVVIDAGSKALTADAGAHGKRLVQGFGNLLGKRAILERLSEEHGIISGDAKQFTLGEKVRIIPNHACAVVNMFDRAYLVEQAHVVEEIPILARGAMT